MAQLQPIVSTERRVERDRRSFTLKTLACGMVGGKRRGARRDVDACGHYVDWYEAPLLFIALAIMSLSWMDAFFTLQLLEMGAIEVNIFMAWLLDSSVDHFVVTKLAITASALLFLTMHVNFRIFGIVTVRHVMYVLVAKDVALIFYQLHLMALAMSPVPGWY
jgi:hypothetical protein